MLYQFEENLKNFVYWCNSCGELYRNGQADIERIEDLPKELQRAFNELWQEDVYGLRCYIAEFNGKYGIAFEAGYDRYYAKDLEISYEQLVDIAREKAAELSKKYPEYDVIFGENTELWNDGSRDSVIMVFMPWSISQKEFSEIGMNFASECYAIKELKKPEQNNGIWWYLMCGLTQEYAVVYANTPEEAFEKLKAKREIETRDFQNWKVERLSPDSYDGVLYFY